MPEPALDRIAVDLNHYGVQIKGVNPVWIKELEQIHEPNRATS